ncbi:hypothetical protein [Rhizobium gallicum]|uniref:hypothetical protein n=1 Tax=Rhizobium gallicum TaxID=56730 RepID=UPI0012FBD1E1
MSHAYRSRWIHEDNSKVSTGGIGVTANLIATLRERDETSLDIEIAMNDHIFDIPMEEIEASRAALTTILQKHGWRPDCDRLVTTALV